MAVYVCTSKKGKYSSGVPPEPDVVSSIPVIAIVIYGFISCNLL